MALLSPLSPLRGEAGAEHAAAERVPSYQHMGSAGKRQREKGLGGKQLGLRDTGCLFVLSAQGAEATRRSPLGPQASTLLLSRLLAGTWGQQRSPGSDCRLPACPVTLTFITPGLLQGLHWLLL